MKQAILYGAGDLRIEESPLVTEILQPDAIYVETEVTALSTGTDLGNYLGDSTYVPGAPNYPRRIGYSNVGVIRRVGSAVKNFKPGQRLFSSKPHQSAYVANQGELLVPIPDAVSSELGSLAYLTQLGLASLRQARYEAGENVVVVGLGVIGLCTIWLARGMGAKVIGISNSSIRCDVATKLGAHAVMLSEEEDLAGKVQRALGEVGADIVILTANTWSSYRVSMEIVRYGGRVSFLGFPGRAQPAPDFNPLDPCWLYAKQLTLLGAGFSPRMEAPPAEVRFNIRRNLSYILESMATRGHRLEGVISHRFPADRMKEAYDLASEHSKSFVAAVFEWNSMNRVEDSKE